MCQPLTVLAAHRLEAKASEGLAWVPSMGCGRILQYSSSQHGAYEAGKRLESDWRTV
jgi:hypothetical protein